MSEKKLVVWYVQEEFDDRSLQIDTNRDTDCDDRRKFVELKELKNAKRLGAREELEKILMHPDMTIDLEEYVEKRLRELEKL